MVPSTVSDHDWPLPGLSYTNKQRLTRLDENRVERLATEKARGSARAFCRVRMGVSLEFVANEPNVARTCQPKVSSTNIVAQPLETDKGTKEK